jgi:transcriptional regulator with XRE-family HTH domain
MSTFGRRLQQERARLGLSQVAFAELGGVRRSSQHLYEHDARSPDADYLARIQSAGVDVGFLISGCASPASSRGRTLSVEHANLAFHAVEEFARKHSGETISALERQRLFDFLCNTLAADFGDSGAAELQERLNVRWAS